jgi:hypothetical protein
MSTLFIVVIVIGSFACFLMQSAYLLWCAQILPRYYSDSIRKVLISFIVI